MNELKQTLKWGAWSLFGLIMLPLLVSVARGCGVKFCLLTYIGIAYLLILLAIVTLLVICVVGIQKRLNQDKTFELQQKALDDKYRKEQARIDVRLALEKEERNRKWKIKDEARTREITLEDKERERKWRLEDEANAKTTTK